MQLVTISNRPALALETLEFIAAWMPFVSEVIYVCPGPLIDAFATHATQPRVIAVAEEELLGDQLAQFRSSSDHQIKNWLLRTSLLRLERLSDTFLMADDDSRPLAEIPIEAFFEDGCFHAYSAYDLGQWQARATDYDLGQHQTRELLARHGYSTRSYSAHMPQILDKALLAEVVATLEEETRAGLAIDEWSAYFNIARGLHPDRFHPPKLYQTLCWPALPTDWDVGVRATAFSFENTYPPLYGRGGLFEGIPQSFDATRQAEHSAEKIRRRMAVQDVYDSRAARLLRRGAWGLQRAIRAGQGRLSEPQRRWLAGLTPRPLRRFLERAAQRGDDPAWSYPSFLTRYRCRRADETPVA
ncbi:MAG: hypothetical protein AAF560_23085 [Acidobacteriota bacterium]